MYRCNLTHRRMNPIVMDHGFVMVVILITSGVILLNDMVLDEFMTFWTPIRSV